MVSAINPHPNCPLPLWIKPPCSRPIPNQGELIQDPARRAGEIWVFLFDFPSKNSKKTCQTSEKARNVPACGGLTRNNDKTLWHCISFIKGRFGRRRRPKNFGGLFSLELNPPPCLRPISNKGGVNSTIWVEESLSFFRREALCLKITRFFSKKMQNTKTIVVQYWKLSS